MSRIEHKQWDTPFSTDQLVLFDLQYGRGSVSVGGPATGDYEVVPDIGDDFPALALSVFSVDSESVYRVSFPAVLGFRVMDCDDFYLMLQSEGFKGGGSTFRIRNEVSPLHALSTVEDVAWSYVIASDDDCLEVAVWSEGDVGIELVRDVQRIPRKWMGIFQRN